MDAIHILSEKIRADAEERKVKFRVVNFESWKDLIWAPLSFFILPLTLWPSLAAKSFSTNLKSAEESAYQGPVWQQTMSHVILVLLLLVKVPLALAGDTIEWFLNFYDANNGVIGLFAKLIGFNFRGIVFFPKTERPSSYYSVIGWLDPRTELIYPYSSLFKVDPDTAKMNYDTKIFADLCVMASKLAYESSYVQEPVVNKQWNMCYRQFYECKNAHDKPTGLLQRFFIHSIAAVFEFLFGRISSLRPVLTTLREWSVLSPKTYAFTFTDKPRDANFVVLAFRGTEPFSSDAWSQDFDFSFLQIDDTIGRLHLGFLEALGLVDREDMTQSGNRLKENLRDPKNDLTTGLSRDKIISMGSEKSLSLDETREVAYKFLAFERISADLILILKENPNAQLVITGHSLGGALAALFSALVLYKAVEKTDNKQLVDSLAAVFTFGQPRVGDDVFARFMRNEMEKRKVQYFRMVYAYDLVPRVPFDDNIFGFKHAGYCCYHTASYKQKALIKQPNSNFMDMSFSMVMRGCAVRELINGMMMNRLHYGDDFHENSLMLLSRIAAFLMPGLVAHCLNNYVNAIRLGPPRLNLVPFHERY